MKPSVRGENSAEMRIDRAFRHIAIAQWAAVLSVGAMVVAGWIYLLSSWRA